MAAAAPEPIEEPSTLSSGMELSVQTFHAQHDSNILGRSIYMSEGASLTSGSTGEQSLTKKRDIIMAALADGRDGGHSMASKKAETVAGMRLQLIKLLILTMLPICGLIVTSSIEFNNFLIKKNEVHRRNASLTISTKIGKLIHYLQRERDMTAMFLRSQARQEGTETRIMLTISYPLTDAAIADVTIWPWGNTTTEKAFNKRNFSWYLEQHRSTIKLSRTDVMTEIKFYTKLIENFSTWLRESIQRSHIQKSWQSIMAYQLLVNSKEDLGVERTMGVPFFRHGRFDNPQQYHVYIKSYFLAKSFLRRAIALHAEIDRQMRNELTISSRRIRTEKKLDIMQWMIRNENISNPSGRYSTWWFDNMTVHIDVLFEVQNMLSDAIFANSTAEIAVNKRSLILRILLVVAVAIISPLIIYAVKNIVDEIQIFTQLLSTQASELQEEKGRNDSLLYQMLPKAVASKLKKNKHYSPESYEDVTIFFSDIVHFARIASLSQPMQIVMMLNELYTLFDGRIEKYDVYKIETIADGYMVASGVPERNGRIHALEISKMALDILHHSGHFVVAHLKHIHIQMRIGIHSGPVVAGVVGTTMPRFCLFGDTVNTASRMMTHGKADSIQVSSSTKAILDDCGGFELEPRGVITVKGKGSMFTYWLLSYEGLEDTFECSSACSNVALRGDVMCVQSPSEGSDASVRHRVVQDTPVDNTAASRVVL